MTERQLEQRTAPPATANAASRRPMPGWLAEIAAICVTVGAAFVLVLIFVLATGTL